MNRSSLGSRRVLFTLASIAFGPVACDCGDDSGGGGTPIVLTDAAVTSGEPAGLEGITDLHNQTRAMVSPAASPALSPVTWSPTLAAFAQSWANGCNFQHSSSSYGENIYASYGSVVTAADPVSSWASESVDYDYASDSCSGVCGHYTQIVWRDTTSIGCGIAHCTSNSPFGGGSGEWTLVVCSYDPPGNYVGERPY